MRLGKRNKMRNTFLICEFFCTTFVFVYSTPFHFWNSGRSSSFWLMAVLLVCFRCTYQIVQTSAWQFRSFPVFSTGSFRFCVIFQLFSTFSVCFVSPFRFSQMSSVSFLFLSSFLLDRPFFLTVRFWVWSLRKKCSIVSNVACCPFQFTSTESRVQWKCVSFFIGSLLVEFELRSSWYLKIDNW